MSVLRFARRARLSAVAVAVVAAVLLLSMSAAPVPGPFTGLCEAALAYGVAIAFAAWLHERQRLRAMHADVAAFLRLHA
ncbi:MAG TPA: hypothetical protein VFL69_12100 [Marmoricola sp.]|nr:hypothetical protein [Marmoricola sp.]